VCEQEGALLCRTCQPRLGVHNISQCVHCQAPAVDFATCQKCHQHVPIDRVWTAYDYDGYARSLVKAFKFDGKRSGAKEIAGILDRILPVVPADAVFVHIPTATMHVRERGYDHARLLAAALAARRAQLHLPLLQRATQARQLGAGRGERIKNIAGAFRIVDQKSVKGVHVILVDDVVTTGATLAEAARTLRLAGAARVDAIVFARTPSPKK